MPVAPRAGEVLADLGITVGHQATCGLSRFAGESSSQRPAGAKPSSRSKEAPLKMMWLIVTTPFSPVQLELRKMQAEQTKPRAQL